MDRCSIVIIIVRGITKVGQCWNFVPSCGAAMRAFRRQSLAGESGWLGCRPNGRSSFLLLYVCRERRPARVPTAMNSRLCHRNGWHFHTINPRKSTPLKLFLPHILSQWQEEWLTQWGPRSQSRVTEVLWKFEELFQQLGGLKRREIPTVSRHKEERFFCRWDKGIFLYRFLCS